MEHKGKIELSVEEYASLMNAYTIIHNLEMEMEEGHIYQVGNGFNSVCNEDIEITSGVLDILTDIAAIKGEQE